jgi:primary-amine oxidase
VSTNPRIKIAAVTANGTLAIAGSTPLIFEGDRVFQWNQFFGLHTGACYDEDLLPTGLMFKADITGRDPSKWSVVGWYYNGIFYESEAVFRQAINSTSFAKPGPNVDGAWACTDYNNVSLPHDELNPPVPVQPDGTRFALDEQEKYVEWSRFE